MDGGGLELTSAALLGRPQQDIVHLHMLGLAEGIADGVGNIFGLEHRKLAIDLFCLLKAARILLGKFGFNKAGADGGDEDAAAVGR